MISITVALLLTTQTPHHGHGQEAPDATACIQAQPAVAKILDAAEARLEAARQANSAADLRAAVADFQSALRDVRRQLEPCAALQPHAGGHK